MENEMVSAGEVKFDLTLARAPKQVLAEATEAAKALESVIKNRKNAVKFNGKQYLTFEDWQTCGRFYGVTAKIVSTEPCEMDGVKGFIARAEAVSTQNGQVLSSAESMCMNDEPNWAKKPLFQLRSMAQTRACAKSLRNVLAWVVVLAGFEPNVAEEMTGDEESGRHEKIADPIPKESKDVEILKATFTPAAKSDKPTADGKTKWAVKSPDGEWYSTLNKEHGEKVVAAGESKTPITLLYVVKGNFKNIVGVEDAKV